MSLVEILCLMLKPSYWFFMFVRHSKDVFFFFFKSPILTRELCKSPQSHLFWMIINKSLQSFLQLFFILRYSFGNLHRRKKKRSKNTDRRRTRVTSYLIPIRIFTYHIWVACVYSEKRGEGDYRESSGGPPPSDPRTRPFLTKFLCKSPHAYLYTSQLWNIIVAEDKLFWMSF